MMQYEIIRSSRKTIAIQVKPDGTVVVRCPRRMAVGEIRSFVQSKEDWIEKSLSAILQNREPTLTKRESEALKKQTKALMEARVTHFAPLVGVDYGRISIRAQRTRWGSCSSKGNLNFNCLQGLVPEPILDYVVVHELCHRKHMDHSATFWEEVARVLPDYRDRKKWLKDNGIKIMSRLPVE